MSTGRLCHYCSRFRADQYCNWSRASNLALTCIYTWSCSRSNPRRETDRHIWSTVVFHMRSFSWCCWIYHRCNSQNSTCSDRRPNPHRTFRFNGILVHVCCGRVSPRQIPICSKWRLVHVQFSHRRIRGSYLYCICFIYRCWLAGKYTPFFNNDFMRSHEILHFVELLLV